MYNDIRLFIIITSCTRLNSIISGIYIGWLIALWVFTPRIHVTPTSSPVNQLHRFTSITTICWRHSIIRLASTVLYRVYIFIQSMFCGCSYSPVCFQQLLCLLYTVCFTFIQSNYCNIVLFSRPYDGNSNHSCRYFVMNYWQAHHPWWRWVISQWTNISTYISIQYHCVSSRTH
jgi:hypothetical protein